MISWWFISIRPPCIQLVDLGGGNFHSFFFWIFTPKIKLGTWSNLTNTFQMGWFNHQLVMISWWFLILLPPKFDATANAPEKSPGPKRDRIVFQASFFSEHVNFSGCSCLLVHSLKIWFSFSFFSENKELMFCLLDCRILLRILMIGFETVACREIFLQNGADMRMRAVG